ncbi:MAG: hypothetical protein ACFFC7_13755 [Candidatus Hermodarchaeota archaeon]
MDIIIIKGVKIDRQAAQWFQVYLESNSMPEIEEAVRKLGEYKAYEALGYIVRTDNDTRIIKLAKRYL